MVGNGVNLFCGCTLDCCCWFKERAYHALCVCAGGTIVSEVVMRKRKFISGVAIWGSLKISTD